MHRSQLGQTEYSLQIGDITEQVTEAIVNAANQGLKGGAGVDGAIHERGGPSIMEECRLIVKEQGECLPGNAVITQAGLLPAKHVIHTVGPVWQGGIAGEEEVLRHCYLNSLQVAKENGIRSVMFPSVGTGAFRVPMDIAAEVAQKTVIKFILKEKFFEQVGFVLFDQKAYDSYLMEFEKMFST